MKRIQQFILWIADGIWYACLLLTLPASAQVFWSGQGSISGPAAASVTVAAAAANPCAASTNYADTDVSLGLWSPIGGPATGWECIDKPRGDTDNNTYITGFMDATRTDLILRVTLPGDCDVSAITVYCRGSSLVADSVMSVKVSPDGSTYTSSADQTWTGTESEHSSVFTGLTWTSPDYCYVKISGVDLTYNTVALVNMQVMVNP